MNTCNSTETILLCPRVGVSLEGTSQHTTNPHIMDPQRYPYTPRTGDHPVRQASSQTSIHEDLIVVLNTLFFYLDYPRVELIMISTVKS